MLKDLGLKHLGPAIIGYDNQATIAIVVNPVLHERTKHVEVDCHYVRDMVKEGKLITEHVPSKSQVADILTKILLVDQHSTLLTKLGVTCPSNSQLEGA